MKLMRLHLRETGGMNARGLLASTRWLWLAATVGVLWYLFVVIPVDGVRYDQLTLHDALHELEALLRAPHADERAPQAAERAPRAGERAPQAGERAPQAGEKAARQLVIEMRRVLPKLERAAAQDAAILSVRTLDLEAALRLGEYRGELYRDVQDELLRVQAQVFRRLRFATERSRSLSDRMTLLFSVALIVFVGATAMARRVEVRAKNDAIDGQRLGRLLFDLSPGSVSFADAAERIVAVNPAFERVTGYDGADVLGKTLGFDASGEQDEGFFRTMRGELARSGRWAGEIWQRRKNGEAYAEKVVRVRVDDDRARAVGYLTVSMDPSPNKDAERLLSWQANHDALTKLPNRTLLLERLTRVLVRVRQTGQPGAILSVDIDGFKRVNDSVGPMLGDRLLTEASMRIVISVSENDTVSRLGSDKFAVMLPDLADAADADRLARTIVEAFRRPFVLDRREVFVTVSIGVASFPEDGTDALRLLQRADTAMAQAKTLDGDAVVFYEPQMNARAERRHAVETDLRRALRDDELELHYQPVIDRAAMRIVGAEALVRWRHPVRGLVSPADFIPVAEESGLIVDIGQWVIETVRTQVLDWQRGTLGGLRIAVNLSARELKKSDDLATLKRLIARVPEGRIGIEITESVLLSETHQVTGFLSGLRDIGVRIALDDFGTGYSSLSYLRRIRFDALKIDRSFVKDLDKNPADLALVASIVSMAKVLSLDVVAEGVETEAQLECLARIGCNFVQGYYFAKPMPADAFAAFVAESSLSV